LFVIFLLCGKKEKNDNKLLSSKDERDMKVARFQTK